jgi:hypothetical protein
MFAITLIAVGAAVAAWLRPMPDTKVATPLGPTFSQQQAAEAKSKVCGAFEKVWNAEQVAGARNGGADPTATLAVATSIRQVLDFASGYLIQKLNAEPATPSEIASTVRGLAEVYEELTLNYLDGLTNADPKLGPLLNTLDKQTYTAQALCK